MTAPVDFAAVDPFDLPDWLGVSEVTWAAEAGVRRGHAVPGHLAGTEEDLIPCDLLAVDPAYPSVVAPENVRHDAHQAWRHGQVLLVRRDERLTLAVPGTGFTADLVLEAVARLALAVGAPIDRYAVLLRIGAEKA